MFHVHKRLNVGENRCPVNRWKCQQSSNRNYKYATRRYSGPFSLTQKRTIEWTRNYYDVFPNVLSPYSIHLIHRIQLLLLSSATINLIRVWFFFLPANQTNLNLAHFNLLQRSEHLFEWETIEIYSMQIFSFRNNCFILSYSAAIIQNHLTNQQRFAFASQ